jgi:hypothetical protein
MAYPIDSLPLAALFLPVAAATAQITRLDERLAGSPIRAGFVERAHFHDAVASLWVDGELVQLEDLVLHDARMDVRTPSHELVRAHAVLRARRQIFLRPPEWALSDSGLLSLRGKGSDAGGDDNPAAHRPSQIKSMPGSVAPARLQPSEEGVDALETQLAAIDRLLARSSAAISRLGGRDQPNTAIATIDDIGGRHPDIGPANGLVAHAGSGDIRDAGVYDLDWNEDLRLAEWQDVIELTAQLPAVLRVAVLLDAWNTIEVLQHAPWLGRLLTASLLRQVGTTIAHLACLNLGLRAIPRELRHARSRTVRLTAFLDAIGQAAALGLKEHDRLVLAKAQLDRRLKGRRANSKLPQLIGLVLARPLVSATMIERELNVTQAGALTLVKDLGLREMTGRGRFRAWGIV